MWQSKFIKKIWRKSEKLAMENLRRKWAEKLNRSKFIKKNLKEKRKSWDGEFEAKIGGEIEGEGAAVTVTLALQSLHHTPGPGVP